MSKQLYRNMKPDESKPVPKTLEGLRDAIFAEINALRKGTGNLQQARAISQLATQAIDSIRVEIQYGRMLLEAKKLPKVLLGSDSPHTQKPTQT